MLTQPPEPSKYQNWKARDLTRFLIIKEPNDPSIKDKIQILKDGGYALFSVIINNDGELVSHKKFTAGHGEAWIIHGEWFNDSDHPKSKLSQAGLQKVERWLPAWACLKRDKNNIAYPVTFVIDKPKYKDSSYDGYTQRANQKSH